MRPTSPERPRLKGQGDGPRTLCFEERVTLFISARHKADLEELLGGLADGAGRRARDFAQLVTTWDSARRQARLAHEFGARPDSNERMKALVAGAQLPLRPALVERLPERLRVGYPLENGSTSPAAKALAARLLREASR